MIVESKPATRYVDGSWLLALLRMEAELLLISGKGLNARALGEPAVLNSLTISIFISSSLVVA